MVIKTMAKPVAVLVSLAMCCLAQAQFPSKSEEISTIEALSLRPALRGENSGVMVSVEAVLDGCALEISQSQSVEEAGAKGLILNRIWLADLDLDPTKVSFPEYRMLDEADPFETQAIWHFKAEVVRAMQESIARVRDDQAQNVEDNDPWLNDAADDQVEAMLDAGDQRSLEIIESAETGDYGPIVARNVSEFSGYDPDLGRGYRLLNIGFNDMLFSEDFFAAQGMALPQLANDEPTSHLVLYLSTPGEVARAQAFALFLDRYAADNCE